MKISYPPPLGKARKNLSDELGEKKDSHCVVLHHRERIETARYCTSLPTPRVTAGGTEEAVVQPGSKWIVVLLCPAWYQMSAIG